MGRSGRGWFGEQDGEGGGQGDGAPEALLRRFECGEAKEENLLTGNLPKVSLLIFFATCAGPKLSIFQSANQTDCLAARNFVLVGRHDAPFDNMEMEAAIRKYGGRLASANDFPSKSFPRTVIVLKGKDVPEHVASKLILIADPRLGVEKSKMTKETFIEMITIIIEGF